MEGGGWRGQRQPHGVESRGEAEEIKPGDNRSLPRLGMQDQRVEEGWLCLLGGCGF